ncbi:unnamed protein product, partial [Didymodactylos carnosus]
TTDERNILIESVYSKLKDYCLKTYDVQFQYSDMRWGVQDIASNDHSTTDVCLKEVDRCCQLSLATNCVILISHRYGSRFIPSTISQKVFDELKNSVHDRTQSTIQLDTWYKLDKNPLEPIYILQPIDKILDNNQAGNWNAMQNEIMLCFIREISDIDTHMSEKDLSKYMDSDKEVEQLLNTLKLEIQNTLEPSNVKIHRVEWSNLKSKENYLQQFADDFYLSVKNQIDQCMQQQQIEVQKTLNDSLYVGVLEHALQYRTLVSRFYERNDILEKIKCFVQSSQELRPCVIYGDSGCGKSSIMAEVANKISNWYFNPLSVSIIIRFLGSTPFSSDICKPLLNIAQQIVKIYNICTFDIQDGDSNFLKTQLKRLMNLIPKDQNLVLLLDSIDQLQIDDYYCTWLPLCFPSNVKCIVSTIPKITNDDKDFDILNELKTLLNTDEFNDTRLFIEITKFDKNTASSTFNSWLNKGKRTLTSIQHQWIKNKIEKLWPLTPLVLSLIYDQTLHWHSYDQTIDKEFTAIKQTRKKHGDMLFSRSMRYIQLFGGVSENELEDVLSLDDDVLKSVFQHYLPPINVFRLPEVSVVDNLCVFKILIDHVTSLVGPPGDVRGF